MLSAMASCIERETAPFGMFGPGVDPGGDDAPPEIAAWHEIVAADKNKHIGRQAQHLRHAQHAVRIIVVCEERLQRRGGELALDIVQEDRGLAGAER